MAVGDRWPDHGGPALAREFIANGRSLADFQATLLERVTSPKRHENAPFGTMPLPDVSLGLSSNDQRRFSFRRLVLALADKDFRNAGFELEVVKAAEQRFGRSTNGVKVPLELLIPQRRDLLAGSGSGAYTVATNVLGEQFIDVLRPASQVIAAGAQVLTGLQGNVAIPAKTAAATVSWVAENVAVSESQPTIGQVTLAPKTAGAYTDLSRRLLIQSSIDAENMARQDLMDDLAVAIDFVAIKGGGAGEPSGILTAPAGIGVVSMGTDGGALTWPKVLEFETSIATANGATNLSWITNPKVRASAKQIYRVATYGETALWDDRTPDKPLNAYPVFVSTNVPSNYTKGNHSTPDLSAAILGNFSDLIIGFWGSGIEILVDPYTGGNAGTVRVRAIVDVDVALRRLGSFALAKDIITS
jgi:HK97 family phage major capsid protein